MGTVGDEGQVRGWFSDPTRVPFNADKGDDVALSCRAGHNPVADATHAGARPDRENPWGCRRSEAGGPGRGARPLALERPFARSVLRAVAAAAPKVGARFGTVDSPRPDTRGRLLAREGPVYRAARVIRRFYRRDGPAFREDAPAEKVR